MPPPIDVVTGAFGYSGHYITRLLLERGSRIRTLTSHPDRPNPFAKPIDVLPFNFDRPEALAHSLEGVRAVFNTYWIRFPRGDLTFDRAVANVKVLIDAAARAGVSRFIHVSITNASANSLLPYFHGKALLEQHLKQSGLSYAILRPAIIFGSEDILLHNIAWMLHKFPVFLVAGDGNYRVQPILVDDLAHLAAQAAGERANLEVDAVGPETFTFNQLVALLARTVGSRARIFHVSPTIELCVAKLFSLLTGDVTLTSDEIRGLMADLLVSHRLPTAPTRLSEWLARNAAAIGRRYTSELARRA